MASKLAEKKLIDEKVAKVREVVKNVSTNGMELKKISLVRWIKVYLTFRHCVGVAQF